MSDQDALDTFSQQVQKSTSRKWQNVHKSIIYKVSNTRKVFFPQCSDCDT